MQKSELRKAILEKRKKLTDIMVQELSKQIIDRIKALPVYHHCDKLCLYIPIKNEVDVTLLFENIEAAGKSIYLPKIIDGDMHFIKYACDEKLIKGTYNIPEPQGNMHLIPDAKTLIIMPGAVFSEDKKRIGYGGGYYDRYLDKNRLPLTIAVAYDFQIVGDIPCEEHDISPQTIVTEKRIIV